MPIVYMHGVNTRSAAHFAPVHEYLRQIVAPAISSDPSNVSIRPADWFSLCPPPKWGGISRPRTILVGQGAMGERPNEALDAITTAIPVKTAPIGGFTSGASVSKVQSARLETLSDGDLADLVTFAIVPPPVDGQIESDEAALFRARVGAAAMIVAQDPKKREDLARAANLDAQLKIVADAVELDVRSRSDFAGQGGVGDFFRSLRDRITESLSRTIDKPAAAITVLASELRPPLNDLVTRFLGDVLYYINGRGTAEKPGLIPSVLLRELDVAQEIKARTGEPIVLLTHSMGGQIAYDTVTSFLLAAKSPIKIDLWCAVASQVGFFEELNLFLASSDNYSQKTGKRTPLVTSNLGKWWNVWDHNDIISFTTKGIFADGIDDEEFKTGMSVAGAHGGYLERPSFYRRFADKLKP